MRDKSKSQDLLRAFRESRQQVQKSFEIPVSRKKRTESFSRGYTHQKASDPYSKFLDKYHNLEDNIDDFKTQDLMYFFREKAKESGIKYVIANTKRDMAVFKKLQSNYSLREICLMIEFIFCSNQNYLDATITQPTVLLSSWCNTIYHDSVLWANDEYEPVERRPSKKEQIKKREWQREVPESNGDVEIGVWEDD